MASEAGSRSAAGSKRAEPNQGPASARRAAPRGSGGGAGVFIAVALALAASLYYDAVPTSEELRTWAGSARDWLGSVGLGSSGGRDRIWTTEEISPFRGEDSATLMLVVLGEVYDVSAGRKYYSKGGYAGFCGRDGSRAFFSGDFTDNGLTDDLSDLPADALNAIESWRTFYQDSKKYHYRGKLVGAFYDKNGAPTPELIRVRAIVAEYAEFQKEQLEEERLFPGCNSNFSSAEGSWVWCGYGQFPRKCVRAKPGGVGEAVRCGCYTGEQLRAQQLRARGHGDASVAAIRSKTRVLLYDNCPEDARYCRSAPPTEPTGASE